MSFANGVIAIGMSGSASNMTALQSLAQLPVEQQLLAELFRYRAAQRLQAYLQDVCETQLRTRSNEGDGLFTATVFEGCQNGVTAGALTAPPRTVVHPIIDARRHAVVRRKNSILLMLHSSLNKTGSAKDMLWRLDAVEYGENGATAVLAPLQEANEQSAPATNTAPSALSMNMGTNRQQQQPPPTPNGVSTEVGTRNEPSLLRVPLSEVELAEPASVYGDELVPALELVQPHGASKSFMDLVLTKLCAAPTKLQTSFNQKKKAAWRVSDEATVRYYEERRRLWDIKQRIAEDYHQHQQQQQQGRRAASVRVSVELVGLDVPFEVMLANDWECTAQRATLLITLDESGARFPGSPPPWCVAAFMEKSIDEEQSLRAPHGIREVSEDCCVVEVVISAVHLSKLLHRVRRTTTERDFLFSVARLLLRYIGLCGGGEMEKEAGWHAAIPPGVFATFAAATGGGTADAGADVEESRRRGGRQGRGPPLSSTFSLAEQMPGLLPVSVECFASPFNVTLPHFFSAFPDTDAFFGSLGNFFTCPDLHTLRQRLVQCASISLEEERARLATMPLMLRLEANPPFNHEAVSSAFKQALKWLELAEAGERARRAFPGFSSLPPIYVSFLFTLPYSSQSRATAVRASAEESLFCRFAESIHPKQCKYVHGAQQHSARVAEGAEAAAVVAAATAVSHPSSPVDFEAAAMSEAPGVVAVTALATGHLVMLSCPTLMMVLQDDLCESLLPGRFLGKDMVASWSKASSASTRPGNL